MTQLLISVRDEREAAIVAQYPVDVIDLKNPDRGALGRVDPEPASRVAQALPNGCKKSIALGELIQLGGEDERFGWGGLHSWEGFQFAKIGLAGAVHLKPNWQDRWLTLRAALPTSISLVGVIYAEGRTVDAPAAEEVIELMEQTSDLRPTLLLDTYLKSAGSSIDHWGWDRLERLIEQTRQQGMELAIAGSIGLEHIDRLKSLEPAYIGFRGAVCEGGRDRLVEQKLQCLLKHFLDTGSKLETPVS